VYNGSLDNVDIWAGGMLETTPAGPGALFQAIIRNQFRRIRAGDRFWFENYKQNGYDVVNVLISQISFSIVGSGGLGSDFAILGALSKSFTWFGTSEAQIDVVGKLG